MDLPANAANEYRELIESLSEITENPNLYSSGISAGSHEISVYSSQPEYISEFISYLRQPAENPRNPHVKVYLIPREEIPDRSKLSAIKYGHFQNREISFLHNTQNGSIEIFDKENRKFFLIAPALRQLTDSISAFNLYYLKQILNSLNYVNMHGAVVGRNDSGLFLANKGGSGKSSLMAYCVSQGMQTLGDDFLTVGRDQVANFYSLYRHFKLSESSPALKLARENFREIGRYDQKQVFEISTDVGEVFRPKMKVKEVLIPFIGKETRLHEISKDDAFKKLVASTLFLNGATFATIKTLREMLEEIPVFQLELTPNLQEAFTLIESRL